MAANLTDEDCERMEGFSSAGIQVGSAERHPDGTWGYSSDDGNHFGCAQDEAGAETFLRESCMATAITRRGGLA